MKATLVLAMLALARPCSAYDTIRFLDTIKVDKPAKPAAIAAGNGRHYVVDAKKGRIQIYSAGGTLIKSVGEGASKKEALSEPQGLAVGPDGRLYVADTGNSRIVILDADGNPSGSFGARGSAPGMLHGPESVAVGADGRVYVADTGNARLEVFTGEGIYLYGVRAYGKPAAKKSLDAPSKVAVDPSDRVYVLDRGLQKTVVFDPRQALLAEFGLKGEDFVVDRYGYLYTLDSDDAKVIEANAYGGSPGRVMGRFGSVGSGTGQFKKPQGLALAQDGTLWVSDTGNGRLQRVEVNNKDKTAWLSPNLETKMSVSGPGLSWPAPAEVLAPAGSDLYAYLPKEGQFMVFDEKGHEKARFGKRGKGPEETRLALGLAASGKFGLYVADAPGNRLQRFTLDGKWQANIAAAEGFFDSNSKEGRVSDPRGVAINDEGTVYVADAGNRRIDAFSPEGVFISAIGPKVGSYELVEPVSVAWDPARFIYFVDRGLKKVFKCAPSGALVAVWGEPGEGPGRLDSPEAVSFDGNNYLYVLDSKHRRVSVYDKNGRWMTFSRAAGASTS